MTALHIDSSDIRYVSPRDVSSQMRVRRMLVQKPVAVAKASEPRQKTEVVKPAEIDQDRIAYLESRRAEIMAMIRNGAAPYPKVYQIQHIIAEHYGITAADIIGARRTADIAQPRYISMYLSKVLTLRSLPDIGRRFGWRDHTTVLHAVRKINGLMDAKPGFRNEVELLATDIVLRVMAFKERASA